MLAVDGALLRTADTTELREHFGSGNTSTGRQAPFPMMRLVALMNVRSHILLDAQLSPYRCSEMCLADEFPNHSVTLFDKGFWGADFLTRLSSTGYQHHWLIHARKEVVPEEIRVWNKHDRLLHMQVSPRACKHNPNLPKT